MADTFLVKCLSVIAPLGVRMVEGVPCLSCYDRVNMWSFKAIEVTAYTERISAHVVEEKPIPHMHLRNPAAVRYFVKAVAGWTPDNRLVSLLTVLNSLYRAQIYHVSMLYLNQTILNY